MIHVYVLNNAYECISLTTPVRAISLVESGKANVVKWAEKAISTVRGVVRIPEIVMLFRFIRAFGRVTMKCSKRLVWERDDFTCQYCGKHITTKSDLQTDHVHPRSKGGKETYENLVTACFSCNQKKADRDLVETGMKLLRKPFRPTMSKGMARIMAEVKEIISNTKWET